MLQRQTIKHKKLKWMKQPPLLWKKHTTLLKKIINRKYILWGGEMWVTFWSIFCGDILAINMSMLWSAFLSFMCKRHEWSISHPITELMVVKGRDVYPPPPPSIYSFILDVVHVCRQRIMIRIKNLTNPTCIEKANKLENGCSNQCDI